MKTKLFAHQILLLVFTLTLSSPVSSANDDIQESAAQCYWNRLQSHEANTVGITFDNDDVPFMDFKVSLRYPFFHSSMPVSPAFGVIPYLPYFAFTGRFGQYISTRESAPVISKRLNPEFFFRGWYSSEFDNEHYISLAYGHESNGQSIDTANEYLEKRNGFISADEEPDFANDYISRGWDYIGFNWKKERLLFSGNNSLNSFLRLRYFMENGMLQGEQEEYTSWEDNPDGKPRKSVDGISLSLAHNTQFASKYFSSGMFSASITTGYSDILKYNTFRIDGEIKIINMPLNIWFSSGYNSDLAQYYSKVTSLGIGLNLYSN